MITTKWQHGFTLLELLTTVSIAALLLALALPSFTATIDSNRSETRANELITALNLARSESIKRDQRVTLCPSNATADDCAPAAAWGGGWLLFVNVEAPLQQINGRDEIVRYYDPLPNGFTLSATGAIAAAGLLSYLPSGRTSEAGSLVLCKDARLDQARAVNLFISGRPQLSPDANDNGIPEAGNGVDLSSC